MLFHQTFILHIRQVPLASANKDVIYGWLVAA